MGITDNVRRFNPLSSSGSTYDGNGATAPATTASSPSTRSALKPTSRALFYEACVATAEGSFILIFSSVFATRPGAGPFAQENHFIGIVLGAVVLVMALQAMVLIRRNGQDLTYRYDSTHPSITQAKRYAYLCYWCILAACSLGLTIAYGIMHKWEPFFSVLIALFLSEEAARWIWVRFFDSGMDDDDKGSVVRNEYNMVQTEQSSMEYLASNELPPEGKPGIPGLNLLSKASQSGFQRNFFGLLHILNDILKLGHVVVVIMLFVGAGVQVVQRLHSTPGRNFEVKFTSGKSADINVHCVSPASFNAGPTYWFTTPLTLGITSLIPLQSYLADDQNIYSCAYDPPGHGDSDPAPPAFKNSTEFFARLLEKMDKKGEDRVFVGWGTEGGQNAVNFARDSALQDGKTKGVVLLGTYPMGVDVLYSGGGEQAWRTEVGRKMRAAQRLLVGFALGLQSIMVPDYNREWFEDDGLYRRDRANILTDETWAANYYSLLRQYNDPSSLSKDVLTHTTLPSGVKLLHVSAGTYSKGDMGTFEKQAVKDMADGLAPRRATFVDCRTETDGSTCGEMFPLSNAKWTAKAIANFKL